MHRQENNLFEFGVFRLDVREHVLLRDGEVVPLPPKALDLLVELVTNSGHVIGKEELMKSLWPDSFVEEANLSHHIFTLRKALGEDPGGSRYIETIPRRGYRFVAKVLEPDDESSDFVVAERIHSRIVVEEERMDTVGGTAQTAQAFQLKKLAEIDTARPIHRKGLAVVAGIFAVVGLVLAGYFWMTTNHDRERSGLAVKSIAVFPLKAVGDDPGDSEYLADGITEALITRLTRVPNLRVIPWVTVERYKESNKPLQTIAEEMRVESVITGSLRRTGDRIAVTISLIDGRSGLQYWADEFEEPLADIFTVQRRIALGAARGLKAELSSQQEQALAQSASRSAEAYEYYLRGKAALRQGDKASKELNQLAFELFQKALKLDSNLAEAYAGIGRVQHNQKTMGWGETTNQNAEASFQQALALNPTLAEAHIGLIRVSFLDGKCEDGLKYAQKAASLGLEDADILSVRGRAYYVAGIWDKAVSTYKRAIELDPANEESHSMIISSYLFTGEYHRAIEAGETFFRRFGDSPREHYFTALAFHCLGDFALAKMHYELAIKLAPEDAAPQVTLGYLLKQNGQLSEARRIWIQGLETLKRKVAEAPHNHWLHGSLAQFYAQLGNKAAVLKEEDWIRRESPDNGNMLGQLADAFARLGESERAVEYYRGAVRSGFLTFSPRALVKVDGTERLEQSPAYHEFIKELAQITDRLREQY